MLGLAEMLLSPAKQAGMKVPQDAENFDRSEYPHFFVFTRMQLGAAMPYPTCHYANAEVIAAIPEDDIRSITPEELIAQGFETGYPAP